jgi:hypothetical protein
LLEIPDTIRNNITYPKPYKLGELLEIKTTDQTDSWYCEHAQFKIKKIIDIRNSHGVLSIVEELLAIS